MKNLGSRTWMLMVPLIVSSLSGAACSHKSGASAVGEPQTEDEKTFYALGLMLGRNIGTFTPSDRELALIEAGLSDQATKSKTKFDLDKYGPTIDALARKRAAARAELEKSKSAAVIDAASKEPGAVKLPSGMVIKTTRPGTGAQPEAADQVKVHYEGKLTDGTTFDSSIKRGEPAVFPLNGVIKCWTEGVGHMKVGEKATLTCPSELAYGDGGRPHVIPGGATLIFEVELLDVTKAPPPAMTMPAPGLQAPQLKLKQK
jgi:FKBP-type peptidyl-prolyl cis-trans isomerase FkpA